MKRHVVVIPKEDGGVEVYPMKEWLRVHSEQVPEGLDATGSTSHELRRGLRGQGWLVSDTDTEVHLTPPGNVSSAEAIERVIGEQSEGTEEETPETAFGLEYQLRDFIAQNIASINVNGKRLRLYVDPTGRDGIEFPTAVGPIDILAIDDSGAFFVFELKRGRTPDYTMGQLMRYMGWVRQTIGKDREVHGVIVAKRIGENLRYSVSVVPNVSLFEYEVEFHLKPAHELT